MDNEEQKGLLEDLILEMMEVNQNAVTIDKKLTLSNDYLNTIRSDTWANFEQLHIIAQIMSDTYKLQADAISEQAETNRKMLDAMETARRAQAEADYESRNKKTPTATKTETKAAKDANFKLGGWTDMLRGLAIGFYKQIAQTMKGLLRFTTHFGKWFGDLFRKIGSGIKDESVLGRVIGGIKTIWTKITAPFRLIGGVLKDIWSAVKFIGDGFLDIGKTLWNFVKRVSGLDAVIKDFRAVGDMIRTAFINIVTKVQQFFGLAQGGGFLGTLGHGLGRLLGVFGWVLTIFDTVTGMWDGFKKDGIVGAIKGGIIGFFKAWAGLGDMILGAVAWVARLFGADDFAKKLEGFSFVALLENTVNKVFDWFKLIFKDPGEALSILWNNLVGEGGFVDWMFKPFNKLIDWATKAFGWRDSDAPEFSIGNILRNIWNGIIEAIATWMDGYTILKPFSGKIRAMKAGTATVDVAKMATPEKSVTQTGDVIKQAASDKSDTTTASEIVRDIGAMNSVSNGGSVSGPSNVNANTNVSTVNISNGSLPDRTDWSVMSGSFGLAP